MIFDLHSHSTCSDGLLSPAELVERAVQRGVDVLALTDHDEIKGLDAAREAAAQWGIRLVNGVEISVLWDDVTLHIVGLNIDTGYLPLADGLAAIRSGREMRAQRMAESLAAVGIHGALEGARRYAKNPELVSRSHFARYLAALRAGRRSGRFSFHGRGRGRLEKLHCGRHRRHIGFSPELEGIAGFES